MPTLLAVTRLLRPLNLLQGTLVVLVAAALQPAWPAATAILQTLAVLLAFAGASNALNDWFDYPIDRINRPHRPLASGALPRRAGLIIAVFLFAMGTLAALSLPQEARRIALWIALPLLVLYTPVFKPLPLAGNFVVAGILGLAFLFAGAVFGRLDLMWPPFGLALGFNVLRELIKDIEDVAGDQAGNVVTFPVKYGVAAAVRLALALTLALMMGVLLPYILGVYGAIYLTALVVGVELPLLYAFAYLYKHPDPGGCAWVAKVLKIDIFFGLLAIYLSRFDG